jgi:hypothetical protein
MKPSKFDLLISDKGWKGIITRLIGIALAYLGLVYLPEIVTFASIHLGIANTSVAQLAKHEGIMYVARIASCIMIIFEVINALRIIIKK